ncbi:MAG TPA: tetratricopeptide repeat protein [Candidatus Udaeobacter sp.]|nr:tetratricopeptide repeat protein [Candidatus Udaeobacter sp.]
MQQGPAFSRLQTVPPAPVSATRPKLWILDSWRDLILYVGTPLLLLPVFALAQARWSPQDIYLFVAAFGAMGHHLPGMIRAYGDRALFQRFKWRFIFAPLFLLAVCTAFFWWDLKGILLVVFFWGVWHGLMQTYGFCRIYDAKTGTFDALTRRLDFAMCVIWFATAVALSPYRLSDTLDTYYMCGGPFIPPAVVHPGQQVILFAAIAVSVLFLLHFGRMWIIGHRPNPVKVALLITSIAFWWYCNNLVANILVGIALFEVFHDVQYLSLVWIYNRNRVEKDSNIGGFMRFVFRRSGSLIGLYVGLVFAYGSLSYFNAHLGIDTVKRILTGVVTASTLLHFYYDGFIWKVRERSTRQSLGLAGGTADVSLGGFLPGWAVHGLKWATVFVLPLGALWFWQTHLNVPEVQRRAWLVADVPVGAKQHFDYGLALQKEGQWERAEEQYKIALGFKPTDAKSHMNLATVLMAQAKYDAAVPHMEEALRLQPDNGEFHFGYANLLQRLGRGDEVGPHYEAAARLMPDSPEAHYDYAVFLGSTGKENDALSELRRVVQLKPDQVDARLRLADGLYAKGDLEEAKMHYTAALGADPKLAVAHNSLGRLYLAQGQISQAIVQFGEALRLNPDYREAEENLRIAKASDAQFLQQPRN